MIEISDLVATARRDVGASLRDDPTLWEDEPVAETIRDQMAVALAENVRSLVARAVGKASDAIMVSIDTELRENGPLADVDAVFATYVNGLTVDLTSVCDRSVFWDERLAALRAAIAAGIELIEMDPVDDEMLQAYIDSDPRISWIEIDKPAPAPVEAPKLKRARPRGAPAAQSSVDAIVHLRAGGITDTDTAELLGVARSYVSLMASGKRPWPGLTPSQLASIRNELKGRTEALAAALVYFDSAEATKASPPHDTPAAVETWD